MPYNPRDDNAQIYMLARAFQKAGSAIKPLGALAQLHLSKSQWITDAGARHLVSKLPNLSELSLTAFSCITPDLAARLLQSMGPTG